MSNEDQIYQLIENYLNGQLSGDELNSFKKELGQNEALNKKVEAHRLANEMVIEYRLQNVKSILQQEKINYGRKNIWKKIISGITGGLILATLLFFLINKENLNHEQQISSNSNQNIINKENTFTERKEDKNIKAQTSNNFNNPAIIEKSKNENKAVTYKDSSILIINEQVPESKVINSQTAKIDDESIHHTQPSVTPHNCEQVDITYHLSIKPSCEGEENGSIIISGFKGGTGPYNYYVSNNNHELTHSNLSAGTYSVMIKDSKGCIKNIPDLEILEKHCQKDYSFNPSLGESWEIPSYKNSGTLILYDEGGIVYFTEEIGAGAKQQWSGQSKNGDIKTGYFLFVINYKDGTSKHGSVTIVH
jgi:hypothetical protein